MPCGLLTFSRVSSLRLLLDREEQYTKKLMVSVVVSVAFSSGVVVAVLVVVVIDLLEAATLVSDVEHSGFSSLVGKIFKA